MRALLNFFLLSILLLNPLGSHAQFSVSHRLVFDSDTTLELRIHNTSDSTYVLWLDDWRIFLPFEKEIDVHHSISSYPINQLILFKSPLNIQSSVSYSNAMQIREGSMKQVVPNDILLIQIKLLAIPQKDQFTSANLKGSSLSYSFSFAALADTEMERLDPDIFRPEDFFYFPLLCSERFNFYSDNPVIFSPLVQQEEPGIDYQTWRRFFYKEALSFE